MAVLWLTAGLGCSLAHLIRADVPSGSPRTLYATLGSVFLGLSLGSYASHWWPPPSRIESILERFPRAAAAAFWIVLAAFGLWMLRGSEVSGPWSLGVWFGYVVGLATAASVRTRPAGPPRLPAVRWLCAGLLVLTPFVGDGLLRRFSLDITDTVGDLRKASVTDAVRLRMRLCNNGECLTRRDWACGFDNGDEEDFDSCFEDVLATADPSLPLDTARKYCGNLTMTFVGAIYSDEERCQRAGGVWGVKSAPPRRP